MLTFVLASASTARQRLLRMVGIKPIVAPSYYDESLVKLTNPEHLVNTLALHKVETIAPKFSSALILGCDSVLVVDGHIYGKPKNHQEACKNLHKMQGHFGELHTGHALIDTVKNKRLIKCNITRVYFAHMDDAMIQAYVNTGEPLRCAGSFALEGCGGLFIEKIEGCHSNVIGLSLPLLRQMLSDLDYRILDFW
ncbi:Maf family protein [Richelia intracellularis]|uniref:Maf family protein n=1 Tax=Richelia intracellularis TaxID=1164990 RepID=UPI0009DB323D|nr:Maf family protein [Richelia intracellularis]